MYVVNKNRLYISHLSVLVQKQKLKYLKTKTLSSLEEKVETIMMWTQQTSDNLGESVWKIFSFQSSVPILWVQGLSFFVVCENQNVFWGFPYPLKMPAYAFANISLVVGIHCWKCLLYMQSHTQFLALLVQLAPFRARDGHLYSFAAVTVALCHAGHLLCSGPQWPFLCSLPKTRTITPAGPSKC